jgi:hypothetical protein
MLGNMLQVKELFFLGLQLHWSKGGAPRPPAWHRLLMPSFCVSKGQKVE